jgi:hypothetical protein
MIELRLPQKNGSCSQQTRASYLLINVSNFFLNLIPSGHDSTVKDNTNMTTNYKTKKELMYTFQSICIFRVISNNNNFIVIEHI